MVWSSASNLVWQLQWRRSPLVWERNWSIIWILLYNKCNFKTQELIFGDGNQELVEFSLWWVVIYTSSVELWPCTHLALWIKDFWKSIAMKHEYFFCLKWSVSDTNLTLTRPDTCFTFVQHFLLDVWFKNYFLLTWTSDTTHTL